MTQLQTVLTTLGITFTLEVAISLPLWLRMRRKRIKLLIHLDILNTNIRHLLGFMGDHPSRPHLTRFLDEIGRKAPEKEKAEA